ncbi:uncharacterized protein LOC124194913 isoform X2 [Daphnia pulex]|uniref:uncharacterized protein LOC124194913 isoform X2 n=1 Tax=Daphnia pulex TaxID=6669 RepID=UPI001EDD270E|nr:uncharacterized protein LOC124194913 isoform X2 [Daphnia pulex]
MSEIIVQEVRPRLFRINWVFSEAMIKDMGMYKETFQLRGSYSELSYTISCHLSKSPAEALKYKYDITVQEFRSDKNSSDVKSPAEMLSYDSSTWTKTVDNPKLSPTYVWVSSSNPRGKESLLLKMADNWQAVKYCKSMREFLTIWMDFTNATIVENQTASNSFNDISELFFKQTLCDVAFHFSNGKTIGAHVLILSAGSPVFASMFQAKSGRESQARKVTIEDIGRKVFRQFLIYLYTGKAPKLERESMTQSLYEAAEKYKVVSLQRECVQALLQRRLKIENAIDLLIWSHSKAITKLFEIAMKFVTDNFRELCYKSEWLEVIKNHPELCLLVNQRVAGPAPITVE